MQNLTAEMARYGVSVLDIRTTLGCTDKTARNKLSGETDFSVDEAFKIRDTYFPGMRLEYLFAENRGCANV